MIPEIWRWHHGDGSPYSERLQWHTPITSGGTGKEERERKRIHPRRFTEYTAIFTEVRDVRRIDAMDYSGTGEYILPYWWDAFRGVSATATTITGDGLTDYRDFQVGNYVVLKKNGDFVALEITAIASDSISATVPADFQSGYIVAYPASVAQITHDVNYLTSHYARMAVAAEFIGYESPAPARLATQLDTLDVFEHRPDWGPGQSADVSQMLERTDQGIGAVQFRDRSGRPMIDRQMAHPFYHDREGLWAHRLWWQYLGGSHEAFLAPTWVADIPAVGVVGNELQARWGDNELVWADHYDGKAGRDRVYIRTKSGNYARTISLSQGLEDDYEMLLLEGAMPDQSADDIIQTSWLESVRLAVDEVNITWYTPAIAEVAMSMRVVEI